MKPGLGWVLLSRDALKRAETQLKENAQGVLDEIGFLALHRAYADRFFPGTSVLHTRLRYVLFVPWMYQALMHRPEHVHIDSAVVRKEVIIAGRLKQAHEDGVIGGRSFPNPTSQPPSMVYWTALGTWGFLKHRLDGSLPSRSDLHRRLRAVRVGHVLHDDEHELLDEQQSFFIRLPRPPKTWLEDDEPLTFRLTKIEKIFLRPQLSSITRSEYGPALSLLSELIDQNISTRRLVNPWAPSVMKAASPDDQEALVQARQVAALSAIGRGVYAALVEEICESKDKRKIGEIHRDRLEYVLNKYSSDATACDIQSVHEENRGLPPMIVEILRETRQWLSRHKNPQDLLEIYQQAEVQRKGSRARLTDTYAGLERRQEWGPDEHPLAAPLHYRWDTVKRLVADLVDA
jgi:hypothetical protein